MTAPAFRRICVYCGSSNHVPDAYKHLARDVGRGLADRGIGVVYGGGRVGLMNEVAEGALERGGEVIGVIPRPLMDLELGHEGVTRLEVVQDMHERKRRMADLSYAFLALPGGFGTFEELFEVTTWTQLNFHRKPVGVLNHDGFYDPLFALIERAGEVGFIRPLHRGLIVQSDTLEGAIEALERAEIPELKRWIRNP